LRKGHAQREFVRPRFAFRPVCVHREALASAAPSARLPLATIESDDAVAYSYGRDVRFRRLPGRPRLRRAAPHIRGQIGLNV